MNLRKIHPNFSIAEQIDTEHLDDLARMGFTDIVCNRPDHEDANQPRFDDLASAATAHGLRCHFIPIDGGGVGAEHVEKLEDVLAGAKGKVLGYCRTGTRALNLWSEATERG